MAVNPPSSLTKLFSNKQCLSLGTLALIKSFLSKKHGVGHLFSCILMLNAFLNWQKIVTSVDQVRWLLDVVNDLWPEPKLSEVSETLL